MTALPANLPNNTELGIHIIEAYNRTLRFENYAGTQLRNSAWLLYARLLGYLIIELPKAEGRAKICAEITSCDQGGEDEAHLYENLADLGKVYLDHYIRPFKKYGDRTPNSSEHSSRSSFDNKQLFVRAELVEVPKDHSEAKSNALIRDGYRCVVTGSYDAESMYSNAELRQQDPKQAWCITQCAHIIPRATVQYTSRPGAKLASASTFWTIIDRFGYKNVVEELQSEQLPRDSFHRLENIMTLELHLHECFDRLWIWFDATETPNQYRLQQPPNMNVIPHHLNTTVLFTPSQPDLPLPSPDYLQLHATCARIAHLSGAGQYLDEIIRESECTATLSADGASADILEHAIISKLIGV